MVNSGRGEILQKIEENRDLIEELRKRFAEENPQDATDSPYDPRDIEWLSSDDAYAYHVLLISQMDVDNALAKLDKIFRWRKDFGVNDLRFDDFPEDVKQKGASFPHSVDKKGRRILWYFTKHYIKGPENQLQAKKLTAYWLNRLQKEDAADRIVIMQDMTQAGLSNMDIELVKYNIQCYELYFPAIVEMLYIYDMPWILNTAWKIIEKFLSQQAKDHITFIRGREIQTHFDLASLPKHMGGTDTYEWEYIPENFRDENEEDEEFEEASGGTDQLDGSFRSLEGDGDRSLLPLGNAAKAPRQQKIPKRVHFEDDVEGKENVDPEHSPLHKKHRKATSQKRNKFKEIHVGPHISIRPGEVLVFEPPSSISGSEGICARLNITNVTDRNIVYKVKTTTPERYKVRPSMGPVNPGASISVNITLLSGPGETVIRDKFLILSSDPQEATFRTTNELGNFWKGAKPEDIVEHRMSCVFRPVRMAKGDSSDPTDKNMQAVLTKLQSLEVELAELRKQNSRLVWLQFLLFVLVSILLVYVVFFQPQGGALLAPTHDLYASQTSPCNEVTEKLLRGVREGL